MQSTRERLKANRKKRRLTPFAPVFYCSRYYRRACRGMEMATSPGTAFGSIVIEGTSQLTQSELLSMCGTQEPVNLFVVSPSAIEKAIANDVRFEKAETEYFWPGVLVVRVKERIPALYIACSYKGYAQVDYNGVVMSVSDGIKEADAPVLSGVVTGNIFLATRLKKKTCLKF